MNTRHLIAMILALAFAIPSYACAGQGNTYSMFDKRGKKLGPGPMQAARIAEAA